jgi:hypothetical protein
MTGDSHAEGGNGTGHGGDAMSEAHAMAGDADAQGGDSGEASAWAGDGGDGGMGHGGDAWGGDAHAGAGGQGGDGGHVMADAGHFDMSNAMSGSANAAAGIMVTAQNTGAAALIQQGITVQANLTVGP